MDYGVWLIYVFDGLGENYLCVRTDVLEECGDLHGLSSFKVFGA